MGKGEVAGLEVFYALQKRSVPELRVKAARAGISNEEIANAEAGDDEGIGGQARLIDLIVAADAEWTPDDEMQLEEEEEEQNPAAPQLLRHSACTLTQRAIRPLRLCYEPFGQCTPRARHSAARCMLLWPSSLRTHCLRAAIPSYARKHSRPPHPTPLARPRQRRVMYPPGRSARRSRLRFRITTTKATLRPGNAMLFCRGATPLSLAKGAGSTPAVPI